ncbi:hypothetical protein SBA3_1490017 [Candidatus Sulfopaludibacter sp. SbA3]|nr:hypothetical protein SBA3_1490017 [Candidatus Sulfopaludibacter sp. SbA3]
MTRRGLPGHNPFGSRLSPPKALGDRYLLCRSGHGLYAAPLDFTVIHGTGNGILLDYAGDWA